VNPISIEAKARQKTQQDSQSTRLGPLEILSNLIYLARHNNDPQKVREYLDEAELHVRTVGGINLDLLRYYVKHAGDTDAVEPVLKAG
jgi:hypothetical protein